MLKLFESQWKGTVIGYRLTLPAEKEIIKDVRFFNEVCNKFIIN